MFYVCYFAFVFIFVLSAVFGPEIVKQAKSISRPEVVVGEVIPGCSF